MLRGIKFFSMASHAVVAVVLGASVVDAAPIAPGISTLQDLINTGSTGVIIGDKKFSDFNYTSSYSNGNPAPTAAQVAVQTAPGADIGIEFSYGWHAFPGTVMDSIIGYTVEVLNPSLYIDKVGLTFNGVSFGLAAATVTETVKDGLGNLVGNLAVNSDTDGPGPIVPVLSNTLDLTPNLKKVILKKDIAAISPPGGGYAVISFVDNTFPQVPEPAMVGWVLAGAPLLLVRRRR